MRRAFSTPYPFEMASGSQIPMYDSATVTSAPSVSNDAFRLSVPLREDDELPDGHPIPEPASEAGVADTKVAPSTSATSESAQMVKDLDPEGQIDIQVRNVVCSYTLPFHIDLRRVALLSSSVTFDRGRGVLLKQKRHPSCFAKIYSSGKVYLVGCRSELECKRAARGVARMLQRSMNKLGVTVCMRSYRVCNVLATCKMPFGIKIEDLALRYPNESEYEPELSVGLVWRSLDPKATLRIHTTGSITVTGAVSELDVMRVIEFIYPIVREFRCVYRLRGERGDDEGTVRRGGKRKAPMPSVSYERRMASMVKRRQYAPVGRPTATLPRAAQSWSGAIGNRIYFSDEEDEFVEQA